MENIYKDKSKNVKDLKNNNKKNKRRNDLQTDRIFQSIYPCTVAFGEGFKKKIIIINKQNKKM